MNKPKATPKTVVTIASLKAQNAELSNTVNWQQITLRSLAEALELPADYTMNDLTDWAIGQIQELSAFRAQTKGTK